MFPLCPTCHVLKPHEEMSVLHVDIIFLRFLLHYCSLPTATLVNADIFIHAYQRNICGSFIHYTGIQCSKATPLSHTLTKHRFGQHVGYNIQRCNYFQMVSVRL